MKKLCEGRGWAYARGCASVLLVVETIGGWDWDVGDMVLYASVVGGV
jgi:hypothetical protein